MKKNKWQYDELQQVGVDYGNYDEVARYDARMKKLRDIKTEINNLIQATSPTPDSIILEIGTGTGEFAVAIVEESQKLFAVDVSPVMLEYAKKKAEDRKIENIEFHHAGFLTYNGSSEQFDIIYTRLALHHLPDFWKSIALNRIYLSLKEGGKFYLKDVVYPSNVEDYDLFFNSIIEGIEKSVSSEFTQEFIDHIKKEYSTLDWIMEDLLTKAGFSILETKVENSFIYTYLCEKRIA